MRKLSVDFKTMYIFGDAHLWHDKDFVYKDRGFESMAEHDAWLRGYILGLPSGSTLISLGNLFFHPEFSDVTELITEMGQKGIKLICIEGNHDHKYLWSLRREQLIDLGGDMLLITCGNDAVVLSHYPIEIWAQKQFGYIHLHGHTRGQLLSPSIRRMDCSVDHLTRLIGKPIAHLPQIVRKLNQIPIN